MRKLIFCVFLGVILILCDSAVLATDGDCVFQDTDGYVYDLAPLTLQNSNYECLFSTGCSNVPDIDFELNICAPTVMFCESKESSVCFVDNVGNTSFHWSGGRLPGVWNSLPGEDGVRITYDNGDMCDLVDPPQKWTTTVDLHCDEAYDKAHIRETTMPAPCSYHMTVVSKHACHESKHTSLYLWICVSAAVAFVVFILLAAPLVIVMLAIAIVLRGAISVTKFEEGSAGGTTIGEIDFVAPPQGPFIALHDDDGSGTKEKSQLLQDDDKDRSFENYEQSVLSNAAVVAITPDG